MLTPSQAIRERVALRLAPWLIRDPHTQLIEQAWTEIRDRWTEMHEYSDELHRQGRAILEEAGVDGVHTIPVPTGWSPEQSWEAIMRKELLPPNTPVSWVNIIVDGGRFAEVVRTAQG